MKLDPVSAILDPELLGALPAFRDAGSWGPWLAFLRAVYGLPMDESDLGLFARHTGRLAPRTCGYPEAVVIVGCQSGKSQIAAAIAAVEAAGACVRGDRGVVVPLIAQDERGGMRVLLEYVEEIFEVPVLQQYVTRSTSRTLELAGGRVTVAVYPCRPSAVRGVRAAAVVVDELAFFISTEGRPTDTEMLRAVRSRVATTGGKVVILSSPYGQTGALWELYRRHYGREESAALVWQASAPQMHPALPADYLERMAEDDPEAYRSEVLGEFRAGLTSLFDAGALDACVARDCRERLPVPGTKYRAHYDPSGGRGDAAALAIGHRDEAADVAVLDLVRRWPAPHNPETAIAEAAAELQRYGVSAVQVDRYGGNFPTDTFARHEIFATIAEAFTSDHYLAALPMVNAGRVLLLDHPDLLRELRGLERRRGTGGHDRVDHRPGPGSHDDVAAAAAGVMHLLKRPAGIVSAAAHIRQPDHPGAHTFVPRLESGRVFGTPPGWRRG